MRLCHARRRASELGLIVLEHGESLLLTNMGTEKSLEETKLQTLEELENELSTLERIEL